MIKVIASDMDGTLLNTCHSISELNKTAIKEAQKKGIEFIIATGRSYVDVRPILEENNIRCSCILMNGAEFRDENGNVIEKIDMDKSTIKQILKILKNYDLAVEFYTNEGLFTNNTKEELLKGLAYRIKSFNKDMTLEEAKKNAINHNHYLKMNFIDDINKFLESPIEIRKLITFFDNIDIVNEVKEKINSLGNLAVLSSFIDNIEITNINAQKGFILKKVVKNNGIDINDVVTFGDSFNDLSLFTEFEETYAMENGIDEIKLLAKYIAPPNSNDGVGKVILDLIK